MATDGYRHKGLFIGDSVPTNRLAQGLEKRSVPTSALASAMAKVAKVATPPVTPPCPKPQEPKK